MSRLPTPSSRADPGGPEIITNRLRLRRYRACDLDARAALFSAADHLRFMGGPQSREECWARIQRYVGHWTLLDHGLFAIEERATARLVGEAGLARFARGLGADFDDAPEAAWVVAGEAGGQGYATEAMRAAIGWHGGRFGPTRMVCVLAHANVVSLHLAQRLGFRPFAEREYKGAPRLLLERLAGIEQSG